MDFKTIKFSNNWNKKLDNIIFTTIRKNSHYVNGGDTVAITLNDKIYKWAIVIACEVCTFADVGPVLKMLDTGYEPSEADEIFYNMGISNRDRENKIKFFVLKTTSNPAWHEISKAMTKDTDQQKFKL